MMIEAPRHTSDLGRWGAIGCIAAALAALLVFWASGTVWIADPTGGLEQVSRLKQLVLRKERRNPASITLSDISFELVDRRQSPSRTSGSNRSFKLTGPDWKALVTVTTEGADSIVLKIGQDRRLSAVVRDAWRDTASSDGARYWEGLSREGVVVISGSEDVIVIYLPDGSHIAVADDGAHLHVPEEGLHSTAERYSPNEGEGDAIRAQQFLCFDKTDGADRPVKNLVVGFAVAEALALNEATITSDNSLSCRDGNVSNCLAGLTANVKFFEYALQSLDGYSHDDDTLRYRFRLAARDTPQTVEQLADPARQIGVPPSEWSASLEEACRTVSDLGWTSHGKRLWCAMQEDPRFAPVRESVARGVFEYARTNDLDLVVVLVDGLPPKKCGVASNIPATEFSAFALLDIKCLDDRAWLAHELGHLLGGQHQALEFRKFLLPSEGFAVVSRYRDKQDRATRVGTITALPTSKMQNIIPAFATSDDVRTVCKTGEIVDGIEIEQELYLGEDEFGTDQQKIAVQNLARLVDLAETRSAEWRIPESLPSNGEDPPPRESPSLTMTSPQSIHALYEVLLRLGHRLVEWVESRGENGSGGVAFCRRLREATCLNEEYSVPFATGEWRIAKRDASLVRDGMSPYADGATTIVTGHSSTRGGKPARNWWLARQRALALLNELIEMHPSNEFHVCVMGTKMPRCDEGGGPIDSGDEANQRAGITVVQR